MNESLSHIDKFYQESGKKEVPEKMRLDFLQKIYILSKKIFPSVQELVGKLEKLERQ
jgi:hypothetical protein